MICPYGLYLLTKDVEIFLNFVNPNLKRLFTFDLRRRQTRRFPVTPSSIKTNDPSWPLNLQRFGTAESHLFAMSKVVSDSSSTGWLSGITTGSYMELGCRII